MTLDSNRFVAFAELFGEAEKDVASLRAEVGGTRRKEELVRHVDFDTVPNLADEDLAGDDLFTKLFFDHGASGPQFGQVLLGRGIFSFQDLDAIRQLIPIRFDLVVGSLCDASERSRDQKECRTYQIQIQKIVSLHLVSPRFGGKSSWVRLTARLAHPDARQAVGVYSVGPVMQTHSIQIGCLECDLLVTVDGLFPGERAKCPRCGHLLTENTVDGLTRSLAFALAAGMLLVMSMVFPFLSLQANGLEQVMTLPRSAYELYLDGYLAIAILVMGPIIVVPAMMIAALVALLLGIRQGKPARWLVPIGRFLFFLNPWSMVEVFVIGVLVSLVKIGAMATVIMGISFWAYTVFAICFLATMTNLDRVQLWERIEELNV